VDYHSKLISLEQALALVQSNMNIFTGLGGSEAQAFMSKLHTIADRVKNVTITNCLPMSTAEYIFYPESFKVDGWFYSPLLRKAHAQGNVTFIPNHLHLASERLNNVTPDIFIGVATPPDKHGYVSLSLGNTYEKRAIEAAKMVILEINPNYPRTYGDLELHMSHVDYVVEVDYPVPVLPDAPMSDKDEKIGKLIAEYIHDGDCLQLGIGGVPNAVAAALKHHKDLGIHTEMLTSGMVDLIESGVVNNSKKQNHRGKTVATFALGSKKLYELIDGNPAVALMDGKYVNDPNVIALNDNQVSINATLEVDLTGQCCSESIGSMQFSGAGGQVDTAMGAQASKNGRSFVALYSTAMVKNPETGVKEEVSKIVPQLKQGAIVTMQRQNVQYIVTEYGVASLRGCTVKERVERLIAIAHPKFREQLWKDAMEIGLYPKK
jgi:acyl-CoA hydrolase